MRAGSRDHGSHDAMLTPRTPLHLGRPSKVQRYCSSMHRAMEEDSLMTRYDDDKMIDICCEYVKEYDIKFNPTKTVCIKYGDKVQLYDHVVMTGNTIEWATNVRHLGNFVDVALSDSLDCRYKRSMFIGYVNKLISKLRHLQPKVLLNLLNTYCCSFYGSSTWGLHSNGFNSCVTGWNIGVRNILGLPYTTHTWMLGPLANSVHMKYKLYIRD